MIFVPAISRIFAVIEVTSWRQISLRSIGTSQFGAEKFDGIFHLASITDTTLHDQFPQVHDNVESFRRLLRFAQPNCTRVVYASSAATYGAASGVNLETHDAAPANVYAFSK
jgi:ADP-L-glycero-D-manno-heptose 6-epimerase